MGGGGKEEGESETVTLTYKQTGRERLRFQTLNFQRFTRTGEEEGQA